ncbi:ShlB/FhaC/HecB family hemolysin secretion/activation protein [Phormidesmis sp. 146-12]
MLETLLISSVPGQINSYIHKSAKSPNVTTLPQTITTQALPSTLAQQIAPPETIQRPDPNRDRLLPVPQPTLPQPETPVLPTPSPSPTPELELPTTPIAIRQIRITGSTVFKPSDFAPLTQPFENKTATLGDLRNVADNITKLYLSKGYINTRAILGDQQITDGVVEIRVIEGSVSTIEVEGTQRLNAAYIRNRVRLGITTPLRQDKLEEQLRLLRTDPILSDVEATLRPGTTIGESTLSVRVREAKPIYGGITTDNFSPPSVGSERVGAFLGFRNPTGLGDELVFAYNRSTSGGANTYDLNYRLPVNPMNGTLQFRIAPSSNRITDKSIAQGFNIGGSSDLYEVSFRQPIVRSLRQEFALSLGFTLQNGDTFITEDSRFNTNNRARLVKFGQDFLSRDPQGTWALRSQFNFGFNTFASGTGSDPNFFSWIGQAQRIQRLSDSNFFIAQFDLQLTPDNLIPSQQFVIGGGQSVRGYRQNARSSDNGFRFSLEDRIAIARNGSGAPTLQLAPFIDVGAVWNAKGSNSPQNVLPGGGLGLIWQPVDRLNIRVDYAVPFRQADERGNNLQDKALYFSASYQL